MTARAIPFLEERGAEFAEMSTVQEAVLRFSADDTINGKLFVQIFVLTPKAELWL
jgi:hypothetical protein